MPKRIATYSTESLDKLIEKCVQVGDCWEWRGAKSYGGYGKVGREQKLWEAHRLSYTLMVADIPKGLEIDHLCRNRACINPYHLEPVTRQVNAKRADNASRLRDEKGKFIEGRKRGRKGTSSKA